MKFTGKLDLGRLGNFGLDGVIPKDLRFGDGSDGILNTTGDVTFVVDTFAKSPVIKMYESITINSGHTVTVDKPCAGLILFSRGDVIINGTIDMDAKGGNFTSATGLRSYLEKITGLSLSSVIGGKGGAGGAGGAASRWTGSAFTMRSSSSGGSAPSTGSFSGGTVGGGGAGGAAGSTTTAHYGAAGGSGGSSNPSAEPGGGANGVSRSFTTDGANAGIAGTNSDGGSGAVSTKDRGHAVSGVGGQYPSGGGSGGCMVEDSSRFRITDRPSKGSYGGGLVLIIAKGNVTIGSTGIIRCHGGDGGNGTSGMAVGSESSAGGGGGGGGSGGGAVAIFYTGSYVNNGSITVPGGSGGSGGSGATNGPAIGYAGASGSSGTVGNIITQLIA